MAEPVDRVAVVVPARDEETTLGPCLTSVLRAADALDVPVDVVVVADGCTDRTAQIGHGVGAVVVEIPDSGVGAARRAGVRAALDLAGPDEEVWIACTDAETTVPPDWLVRQVELADAGADLVLGTITLDATEPGRHRRWTRRYLRGVTSTGHDHVHGANLGVRRSVYERSGGFRPLRTGEDVDLVTRLAAAGVAIIRSCATPVTTSARTDGRAPGGVSADLRRLSVRPTSESGQAG